MARVKKNMHAPQKKRMWRRRCARRRCAVQRGFVAAGRGADPYLVEEGGELMAIESPKKRVS